jgi:hypothetical protein
MREMTKEEIMAEAKASYERGAQPADTWVAINPPNDVGDECLVYVADIDNQRVALCDGYLMQHVKAGDEIRFLASEIEGYLMGQGAG